MNGVALAAVTSEVGSRLGGAPGKLLAGILAVGLAGLVYLVVTRVRPSLVLTISIFLMAFSGEWRHLHIPFGLDDVGVAIALLGAIYRAWSPRHPERFALRGVHLMLGVALLYVVVSAVWAGTLTNSSYLLLMSGAIAIPYALFVSSPVIFATPLDRRILLWGLFALGVYLGIGAVGETLHIRALVFPSYIDNLKLGIRSQATRTRGPFLEAAPEGFGLFTGGFAAAWIGLQARRWPLRLVCAVTVLFCVVGVVGTVTREAWICSALGAIIAALLTPRLRRYTIPGLGGLTVVILIALVAVPGLRHEATARAHSKRSVWARLDVDYAALRMFEARPLQGFGWGTFATKSPPYYRQAETYPLIYVGAVHNVFIGRLAELGFFGTALWLISMLLAIAYAVTGKRSGDLFEFRTYAIVITVYWVVNAMVQPFNYAQPNALLWVLLGISSIPVLQARTRFRTTVDPAVVGVGPRESFAAA